MLCLFIAAASSLPAVTVYTQDFEGAGPLTEWSGAGAVQTTGGLSAFGFGLQHLFNNTTSVSTLTLTGLAPHSFIDVTFDLAMWDSIDEGSDIFQASLDGTFLYNGFFSNYNSMTGPGTLLTPGPIDSSNPQFGYNTRWRDSARHVTFQLAHTASTATLGFLFPNSQGEDDEAFGIDNLLIQTDADPGPTGPAATPEPATMGIGFSGLAAGALYRLRRRV